MASRKKLTSNYMDVLCDSMIKSNISLLSDEGI
jgi:hypothetical protein